MSDHSITSLIEKLEGAEAGSRELDREIMALCYRWEQRHIGATCWDDGPEGQNFEDDEGTGYRSTCCPGAKHLDWVWVDPATDQWKTNARDGLEFTTSLDAALALAERIVGEETALSILQDTVDGWNATAGLSIKSLPRLFCAAVLRAQSEAR